VPPTGESARNIPARFRQRVFAVAAAVTLVFGSAGFGAGAASAAQFEVTVDSIDALSGLTAVVANSDDGVNFRTDPSQDGDVIETLPDGTVVALRIDEVDTVYGDDDIRWWPVRYNGNDGWIAGLYLADAGGAAPSDGDSISDDSDGAFESGSYVAASTDDGTGLNIRSGAGVDFERIGSIPDGDVVQIMGDIDYDGDGDAWYLVTDGDVTGWAFSGYLVEASQPAAPDDEVEQEEPQFVTHDWLQSADGDGINIRDSYSEDADVIGAVPGDGVVEIIAKVRWDDQGRVWYRIDSDGTRGYVLGSLFVAAESPEPPSGPTGSFIYPVAGYTFTQAFGCTGLSIEPWDSTVGCNFHNGVDLAAPAGTQLMAADGGTVVASGWCDCGLGYYVEIDHGNGFHTVYGHMLEQPWVSVGQEVNQGEVIGPLGSTGYSTGPHVHFMVKLNGTAVDPLQYLP
jgi:uncharacterized protein YgiM (DUF1202 family)